ncbi:MAG: hypothetical protein HWN79_17000 [Candidatus Lokiarchaeota archaeon]|nr:hypothetical protein [Candidatus Lokiarchaeota archaeon]
MVANIETFVYKHPEGLSRGLYNGSGNDLYLLPVNIPHYLDSFNSSIPLLGRAYSFVTNNSINFDYTLIGSNDTVQYTFNDYGLLKSYQIFYNHTLAFVLKLKSFTLGGFDEGLIMVIVISSISSAILIAFIFVRRRKLQKRKDQRKKSSRLLRKIR